MVDPQRTHKVDAEGHLLARHRSEGVPLSEREDRRELTTQRLPLLRLSDDKGLGIPERYRVAGEKVRVITCVEAPTLEVRIQRGLSLTASAARSAAPGRIYLDGVAQLPPLAEAENGLLNLDHHEGCIRTFTLSTCEQAYLVVAKGLDLQSRDWQIVANEPDLDTLLAIWVLLNHRRIRKAPLELLDKLIPMLRLEGAIDVHGFDMRHFCGFSTEVENAAFALLEHVRRAEADLKQEGEWVTTDPVDYTLAQLQVLDRLLYSHEDFADTLQVEELTRAELPEGRLAIGCRSEVGIYRVEQSLREIYGDRLSVIALLKDDNSYTLRQLASFARSDLDRVYERLNLQDDAAGNSASPERWGGSSDIGGSPRGRGTRLSMQAVVEACSQAARPITGLRGLGTFVGHWAAAGACWALAALPFQVIDSAASSAQALRAQALSALLLLLGTVAIAAPRWAGRGFFGLRAPRGYRWAAAVPVAILAALLGASWTPAAFDSADAGIERWPWLASAIALAIGAETLFRGFVHGGLLQLWAGHKTRWWTSPRNQTALIYAFWTAMPLLGLARGFAPATPLWPALATVFVAALAFGLTLGLMRERSESLLPPALVHAAAAAMMWWVSGTL